MIKDKRKFTLSLAILFIPLILALPFPNRWPLGETIFSAVGIPVQFAGGFQMVGITIIVLLLVCLTLLVNSLEKYQNRIAFLAFLVVLLAPGFLVNVFQKNFATGIDAVSYSGEASTCRFEMADEKTLHGQCSLTFRNLGGESTRIAVEFLEWHISPDDMPMSSLMNEGGPYEVTLNGKEQLRVEFETDIDVSNMESHIESGETMGMEIKITSDGKSREL